MAYVKRTSATEINWLKSQRVQSFTYYADKSYKSGEVFKEDAKAIGLVYGDVTVENGEKQPVAVVVEAYVVEDRLPAKVEDADKTAMPEIKFCKE
jgi:hypothetical protein